MGQPFEAKENDPDENPHPSARSPLSGQAQTEVERDVWSGSPSQWLNLGTFVLLCWTIFIPIYKYFTLRSIRYRLSTERIFITTGLFNVKENEIELYRVKDSSVERPFFLRLVGLCNVVITSSDPTHPTLVIEAIKDGRELREQLRTLVERCRSLKGVREVDYV